MAFVFAKQSCFQIIMLLIVTLGSYLLMRKLRQGDPGKKITHESLVPTWIEELPAEVECPERGLVTIVS